MGSHPINLAIRFLLELTVLISTGMWGYKQTDGWLRFVLAIGVPLVLAAIWGTFAVPHDPSRSGAAPVVTPGTLRLIIELSFFGFGVWALYHVGYLRVSLVVAIIVIIHYLISYDRIAWLLSH